MPPETSDGPDDGEPDGPSSGDGASARPSFRPPEPEGSVPSSPDAGRNPRRRTRVLAGVAAGVVLLLVVVLVAVLRSGGDGTVGGRVAAARRADVVPKGPLIRNIPFDCGTSYALIDRLTKGAEKRETAYGTRDTCEWEAGGIAYSIGGGKRKLTVQITREDDDGSGVGAAIRVFADQLKREATSRTGTRVDALGTLAGLGDEAAIWNQGDANGPIYPNGRQPKVYSHDSSAAILFRGGNVVVLVTYGGADYKAGDITAKPKETLLPEKTTRDGAFAAATTVARSMRMRVPTTLRVTAPPEEKPIEGLPAACDLLPAETARRLTEEARARPEKGLLFKDVGDGDACEWDKLGPALDMEVAAVPGSAILGGTDTAHRFFLGRYTDARDRRPSKQKDIKEFSALSGPGEAAFVVYTKDTAVAAEVTFRVRNVLVRIRYWSLTGSGALSKDAAMNGAYTAALAVATKLPA